MANLAFTSFLREEESREGRRGRLGSLIWILGTGVVVLIATVSTVQLATQLIDLGQRFPRPLGVKWLALDAALMVGALVGVFAVRRWALAPGRSARTVLLAGLALTVSTRAWAVWAVHPPLVSDWLRYHQLAISISSGGSWLAEVPTGFPILVAGLYRIFGPNPFVAELLNVALATWTGAVLFALVRYVWGLGAAGVALYLFAVFPSQILVTALVGTEVSYAAVLLTATYVAVVGRNRSTWWAVAAGLALGISQYFRSTSLLLLPAFLGLQWLGERDWLTSLRRAVLLGGSFVLVLLPVLAFNVSEGTGPSLATSRYGGWSLLVGLNQAKDGRFNRDDLELVGLPDGSVQFDARASRLAIDRLRADPGAVIPLAVRKFGLFWGPDDYGVLWTTPSRQFQGRSAQGGLLLSQAFYALVATLSVLGVVRDRARPRAALLLLVGIIGSVAILHTFVEIQTRYHSYVIPILCALAAVGLARAPLSRATSSPVTAPEGRADAGAQLVP